jgi:superfamily II DNA or RNA helicase
MRMAEAEHRVFFDGRECIWMSIAIMPTPRRHGDVTLRVHQEVAIRLVSQPAVKGVLLWHTVGSGKTISALASAYHLWETGVAARTVIVTTLTVTQQFKKEQARLRLPAGFKATYVIHENLAKIVRERPGLFDGCVLVLDECHVFGNYESDMTRAALQAAEAASKTVLLTGTPVFNYSPAQTKIEHLYEAVFLYWV